MSKQVCNQKSKIYSEPTAQIFKFKRALEYNFLHNGGDLKNIAKIGAFFAFFHIFWGRIQPYKPFSSKSGPIKFFLIQYYRKTLGPYQKMLQL